MRYRDGEGTVAASLFLRTDTGATASSGSHGREMTALGEVGHSSPLLSDIKGIFTNFSAQKKKVWETLELQMS